MQMQHTATSPELQADANNIPRGTPPFAETQREILQLLRAAGPEGIARDFLIFDKHYTQCAARIFELRKMGYGIRAKVAEGRRFVTYIMESEPLELTPIPSFRKKQRPLSVDWFTEATGQQRPQLARNFGPLFSQNGQKTGSAKMGINVRVESHGEEPKP